MHNIWEELWPYSGGGQITAYWQLLNYVIKSVLSFWIYVHFFNYVITRQKKTTYLQASFIRISCRITIWWDKRSYSASTAFCNLHLCNLLKYGLVFRWTQMFWCTHSNCNRCKDKILFKVLCPFIRVKCLPIALHPAQTTPVHPYWWGALQTGAGCLDTERRGLGLSKA